MIPLRVVNTLSTQGYFSQFWIYVQNGMNHREAYEQLENDLDKYNLPVKYESYESFKWIKWHYNKKYPKNGIDFW